MTFFMGKGVSMLYPAIALLFLLGVALWATIDSNKKFFERKLYEEEKRIAERTAEKEREEQERRRLNEARRNGLEAIFHESCNLSYPDEFYFVHSRSGARGLVNKKNRFFIPSDLGNPPKALRGLSGLDADDLVISNRGLSTVLIPQAQAWDGIAVCVTETCYEDLDRKIAVGRFGNWVLFDDSILPEWDQMIEKAFLEWEIRRIEHEARYQEEYEAREREIRELEGQGRYADAAALAKIPLVRIIFE